MKKSVILLLILSLALSLSACDKRSTQGSAETTVSKTTISSSDSAASTDSGTSSESSAVQNGGITQDKAKEIALTDAGISADAVTAISVNYEIDDGIAVYDVEFYSAGKEYDYEIKADDGSILKKDFDAETNFSAGSTSGTVTQEQAKQTALSRVSGAGDGDISLHYEVDDGRAVYEGKIVYQNREYDFEIDANSGEIISWEEESVFD